MLSSSDAVFNAVAYRLRATGERSFRQHPNPGAPAGGFFESRRSSRPSKRIENVLHLIALVSGQIDGRLPSPAAQSGGADIKACSGIEVAERESDIPGEILRLYQLSNFCRDYPSPIRSPAPVALHRYSMTHLANSQRISTVSASGVGFFSVNFRIGDYSTTVLDPDGKTFWSANEYIGDSPNINIWRTNITSFAGSQGVAALNRGP